MKVAVIGLGRLGSEIAGVFVLKHEVVGIDSDERRVAQADWAFEEAPGPFTASTALFLVKDVDIAFIVINTSHNTDSLGPLTKELHRLLPIERPIVIISTVPPGTTETLSRQLCQRIGYRQLVYNPVFVGQGRVREDLLKPCFVLIGCPKRESAEIVQRCWRDILDPGMSYILTDWTTAEVTKLSLNAFLCLKVHYGNVLADVCRNYGADNKTLLQILELDKRINTAYMKPGMGFGGPCLPIDLRTFNLFAEDPVLETLYMTNALRVKRLAQDIKASGFTSVAVLGLTYKCGVNIREESPGWNLVNELQNLGIKALSHEPLKTPLPAQSRVDEAQAVVIALPYPEYAELDYANKYVIDPWGVLQ